MASTKKKGANSGEDNSPYSGAKKNLSLKEGGSPSEPGVLVGAQVWQWRWRTPGGIQARWRRIRLP